MKKNDSGLYEVVIDDKTYEFEKWGAEDSLDVLLDISQLIGGPVGSAIGDLFNKEGMHTEINGAMLGMVMEGLTKNLKKEIVKPLIKKLCSEKVLCEGKPIKFNVHYADDLMHMFRVVKAALEVQYGNFFVAFQGVVGRKQKRQVDTTQDQET